MNAIAAGEKFFGLLELDAEGTVLYSRIEGDANGFNLAPNIRGRNFFDDVARFRNVDEFRRSIENFRRSSAQAESIIFTCQYEDGPQPVRVLLARVRERPDRETTKSVLVHIRKAH